MDKTNKFFSLIKEVSRLYNIEETDIFFTNKRGAKYKLARKYIANSLKNDGLSYYEIGQLMHRTHYSARQYARS